MMKLPKQRYASSVASAHMWYAINEYSTSGNSRLFLVAWCKPADQQIFGM